MNRRTFPVASASRWIAANWQPAAAHPTAFVAGYTNGYLHYLPTGRQRANTGYAHEDCDCLVAPEWEQVFRDGAKRMFLKLGAD